MTQKKSYDITVIYNLFTCILEILTALLFIFVVDYVQAYFNCHCRFTVTI